MKEIKQVDPFSLAKVWGVLYAGIGLIAGLIFAAVGSMMQQFAPEEVGPFGAMFGIGGLILFPLMYGFFGLLAGIIGGFLYNVVARWVGGIRIELGE